MTLGVTRASRSKPEVLKMIQVYAEDDSRVEQAIFIYIKIAENLNLKERMGSLNVFRTFDKNKSIGSEFSNSKNSRRTRGLLGSMKSFFNGSQSINILSITCPRVVHRVAT